MSRLSFFRQSAWMLMTTTGGAVFGVLLLGVLARTLQHLPGEYSTYQTLVLALAQLGIPVVGIQTAFAQLAARSVSEEHQAELSGAIRGLVKTMALLWVAMAVGCLMFQSTLIARYQLTPAALWLTLSAAYFSLTTPALFGVLQGRQNFRWLGAAQVFYQLALLLGISTVVIWIRPTAAGAMSGYLVGVMAGFGFTLSLTRGDWKTAPRPFALAAFVRRFLPLTLALGSITFLSTQDMLTAQQFFSVDEGRDAYSLARTVGRGILLLTAPLVFVLFPRIIQSVARSEKTSVLAQALGATALLSGSAAVACTLFPELLLRVIAGSREGDTLAVTASLLKHLTWAFLPLALANSLVSNLLARERFQAVYWLVAVAAGYGVTLRFHHPTFLSIAHTLAFFNTLFLLVAIFFTWRTSRGGVAAP